MQTPQMTRFRTLETCTRPGRYVFDGYVDGQNAPEPLAIERRVELGFGDFFPDISSVGRACWWKLFREGSRTAVEMDRMVDEGGLPPTFPG